MNLLKKNVLILCTGNSCRSIIAEALLNKKLNSSVKAYSSGTKPSGKVNENAKKVLLENNCWNDRYHSKQLDEVMDIDYDLVVTVCDNANETCPVFPKSTDILHISFEDPDGKEYDEFIETYRQIENVLIPKVSIHLNK